MRINPLKSRWFGALCAAALLAGLASGCRDANRSSSGDSDSAPEAARAATAAAKTWLALIDNGNYSQSWSESSGFFQRALTEADWKSALEKSRKPLGNLVSRQLKTTQHAAALPGAPNGSYVIMEFETSFAGMPSAVETVTFALEQDGQWKAAGYFIK